MSSKITNCQFTPALTGVLQETDASKAAWGAAAWPWRFPFPALSFGSGSGAGNLQWQYIAGVTVAGGGSTILDLFGGTLLDELGNSLVFTSVKVIAVYNPDAAIDLSMGGAASNPWEGFTTTAGSKPQIPHGGCIIFMAPNGYVTAVDATHRNLQFNNPGGSSVTLQVGILG